MATDVEFNTFNALVQVVVGNESQFSPVLMSLLKQYPIKRGDTRTCPEASAGKAVSQRVKLSAGESGEFGADLADDLLLVTKEAGTLNNLEHEVIRKKWTCCGFDPNTDGWQWKRSRGPRELSDQTGLIYYKCSNHRCKAKKIVMVNNEDVEPMSVTVQGHHNHQPPGCGGPRDADHPATGNTSMANEMISTAKKRWILPDNGSKFNANTDGWRWTRVECRLSTRQPDTLKARLECGIDGCKARKNVTLRKADGQLVSEQLKGDHSHSRPSPLPRIAKSVSEEGYNRTTYSRKTMLANGRKFYANTDGYTWIISQVRDSKVNPNHQSFCYKCCTRGCTAKKVVVIESSKDVVSTKYKGEHNHPPTLEAHIVELSLDIKEIYRPNFDGWCWISKGYTKVIRRGASHIHCYYHKCAVESCAVRKRTDIRIVDGRQHLEILYEGTHCHEQPSKTEVGHTQPDDDGRAAVSNGQL